MRAPIPLIRGLTLTYALLSAALYCSLMPLWEGFDELYHYACVQHIAVTWTFPVLGKTTLSRELWSSLDFLPVSHYIQPYLERPSIRFDEFFAMTPSERSTLRQGADSIDRAWRTQPSPRVTYEAMQAPLTYVLLAPLEAALARASLSTRVLASRLLLSFITIPLLWIGTRRLAARLGLDPSFEAACLFVVFSCQMLYAETCRIGNDALMAPWLVFFLIAVVDCVELPSNRRTAWAALILGLGLLIKSSLLVFVPLVFVAPALSLIRGKWRPLAMTILVLGVTAGPWYLRNMLLYRNLTGHVEATAGVGAKELLQAASILPWLKAIPEMARNALWTGNNSFTTFSATTLNVVLALLGLALVFYCLPARRTWLERISIAAILLYIAGLVMITLTFFASSKGKVIGAMPWYCQVLLAPIIALAFLGLSRHAALGRWISMATVLVWAYVAAVSWLAKLVPLYGGFEHSHARINELLAWYLHDSAERNSVLANLCPGPLWLLYPLLTAIIISCCCACFGVCQSQRHPGRLPDLHTTLPRRQHFPWI